MTAAKGGKRRRSVSEAPADLRAEREAFVRSFLHKGVALTEDLIRENQKLEAQVHKQASDNARLKAQLLSNDAMRKLLTTIEALEEERNALLARSDELERSYEETKARAGVVDQEFNDMASLYIASSQLGATLSVRAVVRHICELLEQLIGAQRFVLYALSPDGKRALPIGSRGTQSDALHELAVDEAVFADACLTGIERVFEPEQKTKDQPLAILPLGIADEVVAVIVIHELLAHKEAWVPVDHELFKLLRAHAAPALIGANLYAQQQGPRAALEGVHEHFETSKANG